MLQAVAGLSQEEEDGEGSETATDASGEPGQSSIEAAPAAAAGGSGRPAGLAVGSLEAMLLDKNRHLEHELTMARLRVAELTGAFPGCSEMTLADS